MTTAHSLIWQVQHPWRRQVRLGIAMSWTVGSRQTTVARRLRRWSQASRGQDPGWWDPAAPEMPSRVDAVCARAAVRWRMLLGMQSYVATTRQQSGLSAPRRVASASNTTLQTSICVRVYGRDFFDGKVGKWEGKLTLGHRHFGRCGALRGGWEKTEKSSGRLSLSPA